MGLFFNAVLFQLGSYYKYWTYSFVKAAIQLLSGCCDAQIIIDHLVSSILSAFCFVFSIGVIIFIAMYYCNNKLDFLKSLEDPTAPELETMSPLKLAVFSCLLTRGASRTIGRLMDVKIPYYFRRPLYACACKAFKIDVNEFEGKYEDYQSPNCFFTRTLKSNVRHVLHHPLILVSPCDGTVSYMDSNPVTTPKLQVHQVKGVRYMLSDFLGETPIYHNNENSIFTITIYLAPSDYHRVHSPSCFNIKDRVHFPGKLLPVKNYFAQKVKGLFTINERVVLNGTWDQGFFALGMVGAYNVGSISLANRYDRNLQTNCAHHQSSLKQRVCFRKTYPTTVKTIPGDEVGTFHLGSTVVLAFESKEFHWIVKPREKVKMGQPLGFVTSTPKVRRLISSYSGEK